MSARQIKDRLGAILNPPEITTPEAELEEPREVAPAAEVPGHIQRHHLEIPEEMGPDWSPLIAEMRDELADGVAEVLGDLIARTRPEPLVQFAQGAADATGNVVVRLGYAPLATTWEIGNLYVLHAEATAQDFTVSLEPGGQIDALSVAEDVGSSPVWSAPLYMREGVRLVVEHSAGGLTQGALVNVAVIGRIHSTRPHE